LSNLQDYELAALALDAYQRGYHAGMPDLASRLNDGLGSTYLTPVAGGVVIASSSETLAPGVDQAANFYAIAYQIGNEVIIAYRGSDNLNWQIVDDLAVPMGGADASSVVDIAQGIVEAQTRLAFEFYHAVKAACLTS